MTNKRKARTLSMTERKAVAGGTGGSGFIRQPSSSRTWSGDQSIDGRLASV